MLADTNINTNNTNDRGTHLTQSPWNPVRFSLVRDVDAGKDHQADRSRSYGKPALLVSVTRTRNRPVLRRQYRYWYAGKSSALTYPGHGR